MTELDRRVAAVEATKAKWEGREFQWGTCDCIRTAAFHVRQMGHKRSLGLAKAGTYRSAISARRALTRAGFDSIAAALEAAGFERIAAARVLPGDLVTSDGSDALEAVGIYAGNFAMLGFQEDSPTFGVLRVNPGAAGMTTGWRT